MKIFFNILGDFFLVFFLFLRRVGDVRKVTNLSYFIISVQNNSCLRYFIDFIHIFFNIFKSLVSATRREVLVETIILNIYEMNFV